MVLDFIAREFAHVYSVKPTLYVQMLLDVKAYFMQQPTLVDVPIPDGEKFTVCGDIHGQFYDLMNIFKLNGLPSPSNPYLFNGDFVDRGSFSIECIFTLFGYKLLYPDHFYMSRGENKVQSIISICSYTTIVGSQVAVIS